MSTKVMPPMGTAAFVREVIADMRLAQATKGFKLDMRFFTLPSHSACLVCAGGSAVVFGLGGEADRDAWTDAQWRVAYYCDDLRSGRFSRAMSTAPVPQEAQAAHSRSMWYADDPDFFPAWERFAAAWEEAEAKS